MPATRSTRASVRRQALAEAPVGKQQAAAANKQLAAAANKQLAAAANKQLAAATNTLKSAFAVTKHGASAAKHALSAAKPGAGRSALAATKTMLHRSTAAPQIVGRAAEQAGIRRFLHASVEQGRGGSMYVSGNPGTGKTACLQALIKQSAADFASVLVNCVPLTRPGQVYAAILDALDIEYAADGALAALERAAFGRRRAFLVILDEVDSLLGSRQEVLYRLFELAAHPDSRLALVGIANALDLTDRFLPRLQARNCEPLLLNFNPYQVDDIVSILQSRLDAVSAGEPVVQRAALELCARKVAATSGDLRKALDVCRQATEAAEAEHRRRQTAQTDKENGAVPPPRVTIMHIAKVLATLNGSPALQKLGALNFQQKLALCAHLTAQGKQRAGLSLAALFAEYRALCRRIDMLAPVSRSEFLDLVSMMETQGVVAVDSAARRGPRRTTPGAADDRMLRLLVDDADVRRVLANTPALASVL